MITKINLISIGKLKKLDSEKTVNEKTVISLNKDIMSKILQRRKQIVIHSMIYYRMGTSIVDDYTFDKWAHELVALQKDYPQESKNTKYYEEFKDWDGTTGMNFWQDNLIATAMWLIAEHNRREADEQISN